MSRNLLLLLFVFISMLLSSSLLSSTDALGWVWTKAAAPPVVVSKSSPPSSLSRLPQVSGHVAASSSTTLPSVGGRLLLFGGLTGPAGSPVTNALYEYVVRDDEDGVVGGSWVQVVPPKGTRGPQEEEEEEAGHASLWPRKRMYSAGAILGDNAFYLFGGWDPGAPGSGGTFLNDVWRYDLATTRTWEKLDIDLPYAVSRHGACAVNDNSMIVSHTYQGVLVLKQRTTLGVGVDGTSQSDCMTMTVQETTGGEDDRPDGLSMCAQVALGNRYVFIFGGSTRTQQLSDASYLLDTVTWKWTRLKTVPDENDNAGTAPLAPSARASPCGSAVPGSRDHQVIVFGGASLGGEGYAGGQGLVPLNDTWLATVNVEAGTVAWQRIAATTDAGRCPEARLAATLNCIPGKPRTLLLQGGYNSTAKRTFREPWILTFD
jgi:hypothetical protein